MTAAAWWVPVPRHCTQLMLLGSGLSKHSDTLAVLALHNIGLAGACCLRAALSYCCLVWLVTPSLTVCNLKRTIMAWRVPGASALQIWSQCCEDPQHRW